MEVTCPSCARKHQTENHKNEFEIVCSCGYSILLPDESALEAQSAPIPDLPDAPAPDTPIFSSAPVSLEAQDEGFVIAAPAHIGEPVPETFPSSPEVPSDSALDPFLEVLPDLGEDRIVPADPTPLPDASHPMKNLPREEAPAPAPLQVLVEKSIRSSLGQLLGYSYNLRVSGLDESQLQSLRDSAAEFCHFRPWLGEELKKRHIILEAASWTDGLSNVPEALAVEIYLKSLALGGTCQFSLSGRPA